MVDSYEVSEGMRRSGQQACMTAASALRASALCTAAGPGARRRVVLGALCLGLAIQASGCRFGRAPGDGLGNELVIVSDFDAGAAEEMLAPESEQAELAAPTSTGSGSAGGRAPSPSGTSSAVGGGPAKPSSAGAATSVGPGPSPGGKPATAADRCSKRDQIAVCDPISNTGCPAELGMQCDIDLLATTPTGACVFSSPPPDPNSCLAIFPTESCAPQTTCIEGKCLKICLCDADCSAAESCKMPLANTGFKACQPS